jgi:hypothetical protein
VFIFGLQFPASFLSFLTRSPAIIFTLHFPGYLPSISYHVPLQYSFRSYSHPPSVLIMPRCTPLFHMFHNSSHTIPRCPFPFPFQSFHGHSTFHHVASQGLGNSYPASHDFREIKKPRKFGCFGWLLRWRPSLGPNAKGVPSRTFRSSLLQHIPFHTSVLSPTPTSAHAFTVTIMKFLFLISVNNALQQVLRLVIPGNIAYPS